jgi:hypothetical protein
VDGKPDFGTHQAARKCWTKRYVSPSMLARNNFHNGGFAESAKKSPHHAEHYAKCPSGQHWMERFWLSVFAKGQLNNISTDILSNEKVFVIGLCAGSIKTIATYKVPTIVHCAGPIKFEQQALQQP